VALQGRAIGLGVSLHPVLVYFRGCILCICKVSSGVNYVAGFDSYQLSELWVTITITFAQTQGPDEGIPEIAVYY
jgi:hypothetical protein